MVYEQTCCEATSPRQFKSAKSRYTHSSIHAEHNIPEPYC